MLSSVHLINISRGYGKTPVLNKLNFSAVPGLTGLLGPNGAGKSTLLKVASTVLSAQGGSVEICGETVKSIRDRREARRNIGYLPQDFGFAPNFTVHEFVEYCAWLREARGDLKRQSREAIASVGLEGQTNRKMKGLSGGMRQRAGIAAAIVGRPQVIILDEPTVGLDPAQRLDFRDLLADLADRTVILSTHLIEDVVAVCGRVTVMSAGSTLFVGTPSELSDRGCDDSGAFSAERGYMNILKQEQLQ